MKRSRMDAAVAIALACAVAFSAAPWSAVAADDVPECPQGEGWLQCRAEAGDRLALYKLGRNAYDNARTSGDFSEALRLARKLAAEHDKNGERLLKMVHMQLGWGAHKDYEQAYRWLGEDRTPDADYIDKWLRNLAEKMTPEQLARAQKPVRN